MLHWCVRFQCDMQEYWSGNQQAHGGFLHSPLLDELRAYVQLSTNAAGTGSVRVSSEGDEEDLLADLPMLPSMTARVSQLAELDDGSHSGATEAQNCTRGHNLRVA